MLRSVTASLTSPYGILEAWFYDRLIAPALVGLAPGLYEELLAELRPGDRVLDVGCGGGQLEVLLAGRRPDLRLTALDLSQGQARRARRRTSLLARGRGAHPASSPVEVVRGSALALPFGDGLFDGVVSIASLKHWPDPGLGLAECLRVLRPGGGLAVVEADRGCRHQDARAFVDRWRLPRPLRPAALVLFRTFVAGQTLDLDDARALAAALPLDPWDVRRIAGTPGLVLRGRKRG
jgi:SAM-dependent methyltransferase